MFPIVRKFLPPLTTPQRGGFCPSPFNSVSLTTWVTVTNGILIGCRVWPQYTNVGDRQTIDDRQTTTDRKSMAQACPTIRSRRPKTGMRMARTVTSSIVRLQARLSLPCWSVSATASVKIPLLEHLFTTVRRSNTFGRPYSGHVCETKEWPKSIPNRNIRVLVNTIIG